MINKYFYRFFCFLGAFLLATSISAAQDKQGEKTFANVNDEIRYYLTEEDYSILHVDQISIDKKAFERAAFLSRNYESLFIEQAKELVAQAHGGELAHLIWILKGISGPDHRPLIILFRPESFETTFKNAAEIRAELVQSVKRRHYGRGCIYAVEALAALKHRAAIPEIISFLNDDANRDVLLTLFALADLDAKAELTTYLQEKLFEDFCIRKHYNVRGYTVSTDSLTNAFWTAANDSKYAPYFRAILQKMIWNEPDQATLARFAREGSAERLRGYAVLLLSHYRNEAATNAILDRLKNDPSGLVRFWAAQSFVSNPDVRAVDTLIAVYNQSSDDGRMRFGCVEALGSIGGEKAVVILRRALNDEDSVVRDMAKMRLEQLARRPN